jgi:hypothetical protein
MGACNHTGKPFGKGQFGQTCNLFADPRGGKLNAQYLKYLHPNITSNLSYSTSQL